MKQLIILLCKCFSLLVCVSELNWDPGLRDSSSRRFPRCNDAKGS
jgi:hypothetical protein